MSRKDIFWAPRRETPRPWKLIERSEFKRVYTDIIGCVTKRKNWWKNQLFLKFMMFIKVSDVTLGLLNDKDRSL
jgi:hypothetical protein